jgi:HK97 family phage major capsid protein
VTQQDGARGRQQTHGGKERDMRTAAAATPAHGHRSGGYANRGDFLRAVAGACALNWRSPSDDRLRALMAAVDASGEGSGDSAGYAVPVWWQEEILATVLGPGSLAGRCAPISIPRGNQVTIGIDETTPWQTTGGVQVYWTDEAAQQTQSKAKLQARTLRLRKLIALAPVTNELLDDAPGLEASLVRAATAKLGYALDSMILTGSGQRLLGLLRCPAKITVTKDSGQAAATFSVTNARSMASRMISGARRRAVWIMGTDAFAQVEGFAWPVYQPATDTSGPRLLGNEILLSEASPALGQEGDVIFADLGSYLLARRAKADVSMHLFFDVAATAFRWSIRCDGMPALGAPIARPNSASTASTVLTVEARP